MNRKFYTNLQSAYIAIVPAKGLDFPNYPTCTHPHTHRIRYSSGREKTISLTNVVTVSVLLLLLGHFCYI